MKLVLDGVFNHMGRNSVMFQDASKSESSQWRKWFYFGSQYPQGARAWSGAENLLELNLENPEVRAHIYGDKNSVIRSYLRDGVDGWRLDTAFELGAPYLKELTAAAHAERAGSLVVGEVPQYPREWFPSMDAVMNFTIREIIFGLVNETIAPTTALRMMDRMTAETGIEAMLKSWTLLDNHDVPRLATALPKQGQQRFAQALLFTLPGSPNVYYGSEVAMEGGDDPEMRSPMRWDLVKEDNPALRYTRQLMALRKQHRALKVGNFRTIESTHLFAFERYTDRVQDTILVLANPSDKVVNETVMVANAKLTNGGEFAVALQSSEPAARVPTIYSGLIKVSVPPQTVIVLKPILERSGGYSPYKRTQ
jgi:glycosidase